MSGSFHGRYLVRDLDQSLLSTPYKVQTSWHVITGAACSGKTTLINMLAKAGYQTAPETARIFFEREMVRGRTSQEIRDSGYATQRGIFELQPQLEDRLLPEHVIFLDRGLPDSLSFHRVFGLNPDDLLLDCRKHRYAAVFILDRLPFERESKLGPEEEKPAQFLDLWLERDYSALGYHVVRVPFCSPKERLEFVIRQAAGTDRG